MRNPIIPSVLLAALVGGGAALLVEGAFVSRTGRVVEGLEATTLERESTGQSTVEVAGELVRLARENEDLRLRLGALEDEIAEVQRRPAPVGASTAAPTGEDERSREELQQLITTLLRNDREVPDLFVDRVGEALSVIEAEEARVAAEERRQRRAERIEERLVDMRTDLGLNQYQVDELRQVFTENEEKRESLWSAQAGVDAPREDVREGMRELRESTEASLTAILTPDQFARYQESQRDRFRGGFGGRGTGGVEGRDGQRGN